jgi:wyosine [tRNA(Phe)-imidazoG37] synthetase (radical SAM superfamily)
MSIAYGPVPSRRLGRSLGINNIPPKICSYSCIYCQLGKTTHMQTGRDAFYDPRSIAVAVEEKVNQCREKVEQIDYLTFMPDGEPTLDVNLGKEINLLRPLGIKIAVITNASLIWREDVRQDLREADYVSLKVDAVSKETWRRINRPQKLLRLNNIADGMLKFANIFSGDLATETMLAQGVNDNSEEIESIADLLKELKPDKSYLAIPIRPPAESAITAPGEEAINTAYQTLKERLSDVEYLIGYEGNAFACTGNAKDDLLSITSVHPMREDAVAELLHKAGANWQAVLELIDDGRLVRLEYQGNRFYTRRLPTSETRRTFLV